MVAAITCRNGSTASHPSLAARRRTLMLLPLSGNSSPACPRGPKQTARRRHYFAHCAGSDLRRPISLNIGSTPTNGSVRRRNALIAAAFKRRHTHANLHFRCLVLGRYISKELGVGPALRRTACRVLEINRLSCCAAGEQHQN